MLHQMKIPDINCTSLCHDGDYAPLHFHYRNQNVDACTHCVPIFIMRQTKILLIVNMCRA